MDRHVPGSLYAPLNKAFNTVVGSLVVDETTPLLLIVDESRSEEAVRDLVRIGYDNVPAFATPETLGAYFDGGGESASIPTITFEDVAALHDGPGTAVLDVRFASEFEEGHVPGAVNASYTRLPAYLDERVPTDVTLLVYCQSGARSAAASSYLALLGRDVRYVGGNWSDWAGSGREVERDVPELVAENA
jgi:hydroxyacylglutathione hydrolase